MLPAALTPSLPLRRGFRSWRRGRAGLGSLPPFIIAPFFEGETQTIRMDPAKRAGRLRAARHPGFGLGRGEEAPSFRLEEARRGEGGEPLIPRRP
jgi:hypothetical protein